MHPVKILSDPLGGKEFAEARERRNKSRGPENGETNPLTTFDYVIRTHGRDRSCVRSIHRIALLPPPPPLLPLSLPLGVSFGSRSVAAIDTSLYKLFVSRWRG